MNNQTDSIYILYPELIKYPLIIKVLIGNKNKDGISCISQKEIGKQIGLSQTGISKYLKRLEQYDKCIEKISPGKYIVHKLDMITHGPVSKVIAFHNEVVKDHNFLSLEFKKQVEKLKISKDAVVMSKHYFIQYLKKLDRFQDEEEPNKAIEKEFIRYMARHIEK